MTGWVAAAAATAAASPATSMVVFRKCFLFHDGTDVVGGTQPLRPFQRGHLHLYVFQADPLRTEQSTQGLELRVGWQMQ